MVGSDVDLLGKMLGVLVVETHSGELGFIKAFSGKLDKNTWPKGFVPPLFDVHDSGGFYKNEEKKISRSRKIVVDKDPYISYIFLILNLQNCNFVMPCGRTTLKRV